MRKRNSLFGIIKIKSNGELLKQKTKFKWSRGCTNVASSCPPPLKTSHCCSWSSCFLVRVESDCWTAPAPSWSKMEVERQKPKDRWVEVENFPTAAQKAFGPGTPKDQEKCGGLLHGCHVNLNIQLSDANLGTGQKRSCDGNFEMFQKGEFIS